MEDILSKEEILFIISDSKNPDYKNDKLFHPAFLKTDIVKVSKAKELILFYGNSDTGFVHIEERHSNSIQKAFWGKDNKLTNTSKFHKSIVPYYHYLEIAENIFQHKNLNIDDNKNPELVDLYIGEFEFSNVKETYKLVLYKNTKIIHTLYPISRNNNVKINTNSFARGSISLSYNFKNGVKVLKVPYKDVNNEIKYEIVISFYESKIEKLVRVNKYDNEVVVNFIEFPKSKVTHSLHDMYLLSLQYGDFTEYENKFRKL
ncbi:hypothetical protein SAMN05660477_03154 [Soonwooa buanensis]|uniref:Uncharacterized protein n=1 Tax=Soonwooa buanensis TaxID=619805 RepID=A0A1T5GUW7_9FLAO|nr:hypothetical protein [Soonwooa buanensis]SKC12194.1 hypothetical protein SAMN05660477_03154 [Soonwooa buanensis]